MYGKRYPAAVAEMIRIWGSGTEYYDGPKTLIECPECDGEGGYWSLQRGGIWVTCYRCDGEGEVEDDE